METFSYHCPACGGALKLNVFSQRLKCESCGNDYNPATLEKSNLISTPNGGLTTEQKKITQDFVEMNLYHCGSCGSEVITNDVEVTKICSFCGQPAIIYDRVTQVDRPDLIIPFKLTKGAALDAIKEKYKKAKCLPAEMDSLSVDSVYAIYIPYYVFDTKIDVAGHINLPGQNNTRIRKDFSGSSKRHVFFDSSKKLNDAVSVYLNPYPYSQAVPFEPTYLSGFYADLADVDSDALSKKVDNYVWEIVSEDLVSQIPGVPKRKVRNGNKDMYLKFSPAGAELVYEPLCDKKDIEILSTESVLCPVYFVTFKTSDGLANILVNGCTGKVVGSIPANEELVKKTLTRNCIIGAAIAAPAFAFAFANSPILWIGGIVAILTVYAIFGGARAKKKYNQIKYDMNTSSMFNLRRR